MVVSLRSIALSTVRLVLVSCLVLTSLAISARIVLGTDEPAALGRTAASLRELPQGADLLAAQELTLTNDSFLWHVASEITPAENVDAETIEVESGVIIASSGPILVQMNETDTIRLEAGASLTLHDKDSIIVTGAGDEPARYLVVELLSESDAGKRTGDGNQVGPLSVPDGEYTLALIHLDADHTDDATVQQVSSDSIRPGVSIIHDEDGVPEKRDPNTKYDLWIVALFPKSVSQAYVPSSGTGTGSGQQRASAVATTPAPASPTATLPAIPTVTPR